MQQPHPFKDRTAQLNESAQDTRAWGDCTASSEADLIPVAAGHTVDRGAPVMTSEHPQLNEKEIEKALEKHTGDHLVCNTKQEGWFLYTAHMRGHTGRGWSTENECESVKHQAAEKRKTRCQEGKGARSSRNCPLGTNQCEKANDPVANQAKGHHQTL